MSDAWTTLYRWQWFQRPQWRDRFRQRKAASPTAFKRILGDVESKTALDCSCGLGLKTIVMKELGLRVWGSDACAFAVEKARELAELEGAAIEYFLSTWADLAKNTELRFDGVFNDALCWLVTEEQFESAIRGIREALAPGGVLVWMGAAKGDPVGKGIELMRGKFESLGRFAVEWSHAAEGLACTSVAVRELGPDYMDEHHLFLISEASGKRLETATIRQPAYWDWPRIERLFRRAGYSDLRTESFPGLGQKGADVLLNVAVR
jgi:SAM-dependent methyltransferase